MVGLHRSRTPGSLSRLPGGEPRLRLDSPVSDHNFEVRNGRNRSPPEYPEAVSRRVADLTILVVQSLLQRRRDFAGTQWAERQDKRRAALHPGLVPQVRPVEVVKGAEQ